MRMKGREMYSNERERGMCNVQNSSSMDFNVMKEVSDHESL